MLHTCSVEIVENTAAKNRDEVHLNFEQLAVIDFAIMRSKFVGVVDPSFSKPVARCRQTDGYAAETNLFARESDITCLDLSLESSFIQAHSMAGKHDMSAAAALPPAFWH